jgi:hypothetical protein
MSWHRAVEYATGDTRECRVCGRGVTGFGPTLRHLGEGVPTVVPEAADERAMARAREVSEATLRSLPRDASERDIVTAVLGNLYREGLLRRNRGPRRGSVVEDERDPDHAERAAGALVKSA